MNEQPVCERCGHHDLVKGTLGGGGGQFGFRPDGVSRLAPVNEASEVRGIICMACGHLRLIGDRRWVAKLLGR